MPRTPPDNTPAPRAQKLPPGFPRPVRLIVLRRDGGCFLRGLGGCWGQVQAHHRQPVGAGGTSDPGKHVPSNGLGLCEAHHGWVHGHPLLARPLGLLVRRSQDWHPFGVSADNGRTWWLLADDGTRRRVTRPAANTEEYEVAA